MRPDLGDACSVRGSLCRHHDLAAIGAQQEVMHRLLLVESHRQCAAMLQRFVFLELPKVFFVRDARRHGVLGSDRAGAQQERGGEN